MILAGKSDSGKTYFSASCPDPVIFIDMDDGTEALGEQYDEVEDEYYDGIFPEKDIRIIPIDMDKESTTKKLKGKKEVEFSTAFINALDNAERAIIDIDNALKEGAKIGTIVFETATWLWMACQDWMKYKVLELSDDSKDYVSQGFDWAIAQKRFMRVYKRLVKLRRYGCNVVITVHTKNTYNNKMEITGEKIHWWDQTYKMSPIIIWIKVKNTVRNKKIVIDRNAEFERIRGVDNAKELSEGIKDITWDKFIRELSRIRKASAKAKEKTIPNSSRATVVTKKEPSKPTVKPKRQRSVVRVEQ